MRHVLYHTRTARILHWVNMFSVGLLTLTGFYIHDPVNFGVFLNMDLARKLHFIFMYLAVYGVIIRIYYSIYSKDYKDILFMPGDFRGFPALAKYYLFLSKKAPDFGKYNPGQKLLYSSWSLLVFVQAVTGFALYVPDKLRWISFIFGGLIHVRQIHYIVTWVFVVTVGLHVYLAFVGGKYVLKSMITGYMPVGLSLQPTSLNEGKSDHR